MAPTNKNWRDDAACRGMDTEIFFPGPTDVEQVARAHHACDRCPVIADCLAFAAEVDARHGIWGGQSTYERLRVGDRPVRERRPPVSDADREKIMALASLGRNNIEIARELNLSDRTVGRVRAKFNVAAA